MKKILICVCLLATLPLGAYRVGGANRPNFSPHVNEDQQKNTGEKTQTAEQGTQTRAFTNYGALHGVWRRDSGRTQKAQQQTTPSSQEQVSQQAKEREKVAGLNEPQEAEEVKQKQDSSKTAAQMSEQISSLLTPRSFSKPGSQPAPQAPTQPGATSPAAMDPSAMMGQLQGLQQMMGALGGGGDAGGKSTGGSMPAGMPDLSGLLQSAGQQPQK